jgi:KUP system potassium uptake protein
MHRPLQRVPGTAIFLNHGKATTPLHNARDRQAHPRPPRERHHPRARDPTRPHVSAAKRIAVNDLGYRDDRITHVTARFGYMDPPNVPNLLPLIRKSDIECRIDDHNLSYFLSNIDLHPGDTPGMSRWRRGLFLATARITADAAEYFQLPREHTVIIGSRIEI